MKTLGFDPDEFIPRRVLRERTLAAERLLPPGSRSRTSFRVDEIAKMLVCSANHISRLIAEGEIAVPQENIDRARSRASIQIPRESLVDFIARRLNTPERLAEKAEAKAKRNQDKKRRASRTTL